MKNLFEQVRKACKEVAAGATQVHINYDYIPAYAASQSFLTAIPPELDRGCHYLGKEEKTVAFLLTLVTINFGSGYFPYFNDVGLYNRIEVPFFKRAQITAADLSIFNSGASGLGAV
jgi:hypothetical protein